MGMNISYTCNWCQLKLEVDRPVLPDGWSEIPIHRPEAGGSEQVGSFCKPLCQQQYCEIEPAAIEHAQTKYAHEFYSFLNKARNEVRQH